MRIFERNSLINIFLLGSSLYLGYAFSPWLFLSWPALLLIDDICYYGFSFSMFDPEIRVQRNYQFINLFLDDQGSSKGRDLEFGLHDGDLAKPIRQAQIDKWETMIAHLKLSAGDSLIDIGCGYGDWLNYAKSKGIEVTGVNMSQDQAKVVRETHGIEVVCTNWKNILKDADLQKKLYGKYDAVTFMGSVEHFVPSKYRTNDEAQREIYSGMFQLASNLIKKETHSGLVLISCLHQTRDLKTFREYVRGYFFDKYYSGLYPFGDDGLVKFSRAYFNEVSRYDQTENYRVAAVVDKNHFARYTIHWNLKKIAYSFCLLVLDPCHLHKWVECKLNSWMYLQFGKDAWEASHGKAHQKKQRCVTLWWLLLQNTKKKIAPKKALADCK